MRYVIKFQKAGIPLFRILISREEEFKVTWFVAC